MRKNGGSKIIKDTKSRLWCDWGLWTNNYGQTKFASRERACELIK